MKNWRDKYEHHLLLKMAGDGVGEAKSWLVDYFKQAEGDFFVCTPEEGSKAFLPFRRCGRNDSLSGGAFR